MKPDFEEACLAATHLLLSSGIDHVPFKINELNFGLKKLRIDSLQHYCELSMMDISDFKNFHTKCDAFTLKYKGISLILYDKYINSIGRIRWSLCHELGHIYLGHSDNVSDELDRVQEIEANFFAAQLLMPQALIRTCEKDFGYKFTETDISRVFGVTIPAAKKRLHTLRKMRYYKTSPLDLKLINQFSGFLEHIPHTKTYEYAL